MPKDKSKRGHPNQAEILKSDNVRKTLIQLSIPAIVGMLVNAIYSAVDTFFIGLLGTTQLGAATVAYPIFMLIGALGLLIGVGGGTLLSQMLGKGDTEEAESIVASTPIYTLIISAVVTLLGLLYSTPILKFFGATDTILPYAEVYTRILFIGASVIMLNMAFNNLLRGEGSAALSMNALIFGAVLNMIFDPILMFYFDLGIAGASWATVGSQFLTTLFLLRTYIVRKTVVRLSVKRIALSLSTFFKILRIGIPSFIQQLLLSFAMAVFNISAKPYGDEAIAAMGVINRVYSILVYILFGFQQGFLPMASYNYGGKNYKKLKEGLKLSIKYTSIFCILAWAIILIFSTPIASAFSKDPVVIGYAAFGLRAFILFFPFVGAVIIMTSFFQAIGEIKLSGFLSSARQGIILIPLLIILPKFFGVFGILYAQPVADLITMVVTVIFGKKALRMINEREQNERQGQKDTDAVE